MASRIVDRTVYSEPFVGGGHSAVLGKTLCAKVCIIPTLEMQYRSQTGG